MARKTKDREEKPPEEPTLRTLQMLLDLHEALEEERDAASVEAFMKGKEWKGGTTFYYRKLAELEQACGLTLVRRARGMKVSHNTPEADDFFRRVRDLVQRYRELLTHRPGVVIGATNVVTTYYLPVILEESGFYEAHPGIDLQVVEGEWWEILKDLHEGRIAFGLGPTVEQRPGYETRELVALRRFLVCHPKHPFASLPTDEPFDLQRLANENLLVPPERVYPEYPFDRLPAPTPGVGRRTTLANLAQIRIWAKYDLGVGIVMDQHVLPGDSPEIIAERDVSAQLGFTPIHVYLPTGGVGAIVYEPARNLANAVLEYAPKHWMSAGGTPTVPEGER